MLLKLLGSCGIAGLLIVGTFASAGEGEDIYQQGCAACHTAGVAGAPKLGDPAAWESRLAQGTEVLVASALNGKSAMPAKGMCPNCTEEQVKLAVDYMLESLK